jgi:hypothetical protein
LTIIPSNTKGQTKKAKRQILHDGLTNKTEREREREREKRWIGELMRVDRSLGRKVSSYINVKPSENKRTELRNSEDRKP